MDRGIDSRAASPAQRTSAAVTSLLGSIAVLFATAIDAGTRPVVAAEADDIELAGARLARLVALLAPARIEANGAAAKMGDD
jgi:hypothetical protein